MKKIIKSWLGIDVLEDKVEQLGHTVKALVDNVDTQTSSFGDYKNQTNENLIKTLGTIESLISQTELLANEKSTSIEIKKIKSVLRKLRYNRTKIETTLKAA